MISSYRICNECKPCFLKQESVYLLKPTHPFERINIDLKSPLSKLISNNYILATVDKLSRFPLVFSCSNVEIKTVVTKFWELFSVFGITAYIHSDRRSSFMRTNFETFWHSGGITTSHTTPYNPQCNDKRYNRTTWKTINLELKKSQVSYYSLGDKWYQMPFIPSLMNCFSRIVDQKIVDILISSGDHCQNFHHCNSATSHDQYLNLGRTWVQAVQIKLCSCVNHYTTAPKSKYNATFLVGFLPQAKCCWKSMFKNGFKEVQLIEANP